MRKNLGKKVTAAITAAAMVMSMAACGNNDNSGTSGSETTQQDAAATNDSSSDTGTTDTNDSSTEESSEPVEEADVEPYTVLTDADGNPIDLGGIDIVIRDWWTNPDDTFLTAPKNDFDDARKDFVEWAMDKYNFTVHQEQISDWGSTPADFVDYVTSGGDDTNYVWVVRDSPEIAQAMATGLMYDLSTLDCLDFTEETFTANKTHEQYTYKGGIYAFNMGVGEPRGGFFINKDIVGEDLVNQIYDAEAAGTWDWAMFTDILDQVQKDTDNDGTNDIWGVTGNTGGWAKMFAVANGGEFVGNSDSGYVYRLEDPETIEGLEFTVELLEKYYMPRPADAAWDYYKEEFLNGTVAFCENGGIYPVNPSGEFAGANFPMAYVACPKGPSDKAQITNVWSNNPVCVPSCYDADTAWACAFACYIYNLTPPGYEDYNSFVENLKVEDKLDDRAYEESVPMLCTPEHGTVTYDGMIPGLDSGSQFTWNFAPGADVSALIEAVRESWNTFIDTANGN